MERTDVVTIFLVNPSDGTILLVRRSDEVRTYQNHWSGISGYLETRDPLLQAEIELREETGLSRDNWSLDRRGNPLAVDDPGNDQHWRVHPFRYRLLTSPDQIELNRENRTYEWVDPETIDERQTVPGLNTAWKRLKDE